MLPRRNSGRKKSRTEGFVWIYDKAELLLSFTHNNNVQQLAKGTACESVKAKYEEILKLYTNELPENAQEAVSLGKDYLHNQEKITKYILTTKLKTVWLQSVYLYFSIVL